MPKKRQCLKCLKYIKVPKVMVRLRRGYRFSGLGYKFRYKQREQGRMVKN